MLWTMKQYLICDVRPGMVLGQPVISENGKVIISENTVLTAAAIRGLEQWNVSSLFIKEPTLDDNDELLSFAAEHQQFVNKHLEVVKVLSGTFQRARESHQVLLEQMVELADNSLNALIDTAGALTHLQLIRRADDYTFRHSSNVGIIVGVLGKWMGYQGKKLQDLILAGFIHDIGKTQIPLTVLNKPSRLTDAEREIMQEHATLGYELTKKAGGLSDQVLLGIWQHHERMDRTGYPFGLSGDEIVETARIIAVADTYDAMTSNRVYQKAVTPFKVIEEIFAEMFNKLDPGASTTFLNNLKDTLIGNIVRLSDGSLARVIYLDKDRVINPIVKSASGSFIDLEKRKDILITEVVSI